MSYEPPDRIRDGRHARQQPQEMAQPEYEIVPAQQQYEISPVPVYRPVRAQPQGLPAVVAPKNPAVSLILSFFIPGLGTMTCGKVGKGVTILLLYMLGIGLSVFLIGIPLALGMWIWGMVDAHNSAQRWNRAHGIIS
jgi:TM2 domain-containing membrane protein YozV